MKAPFSTYLASIEGCMRDVVARLRAHYDYVSLLATDSEGWRIQIGQRAKAVTNATMTTERGNVIRVANDGLYGEYAFNVFDPAHPEAIAESAQSALDAQLRLLKLTGVQVYETGILPDEPCTLTAEFDTESLPETADQKALIANLSALSDAAMAKDDTLVDCQLVAQSTHISKLFLTEHRNLRQSYVYSEGTILPISVFEGRSVYTHLGISGRQGPELFDGLKDKLD
ncbi:MAG: TldD/PmbA family protein, partial [Clostridia bacterium]|nr:TldD/PmbA family protein [Clostridia bacterium]